jgi:hypothetical protein
VAFEEKKYIGDVPDDGAGGGEEQASSILVGAKTRSPPPACDSTQSHRPLPSAPFRVTGFTTTPHPTSAPPPSYRTHTMSRPKRSSSAYDMEGIDIERGSANRGSMELTPTPPSMLFDPTVSSGETESNELLKTSPPKSVSLELRLQALAVELRARQQESEGRPQHSPPAKSRSAPVDVSSVTLTLETSPPTPSRTKPMSSPRSNLL